MSDTPPFGRFLTAMITPFDSAGAVDYDRTWRLAEFLVDNGHDGLVITGTTGEAPVLTADEKIALYRTVVEAVGDRAAVVAGSATYDTRESVELTTRAAETGVDGVMLVAPYYSKPSQEGMYQHFTTITDSAELPVMVYNVPHRTSRRIEVDTIARLAQHPRIVAIKDACDDIVFTSREIAAIPADFAVYSGSDMMTLPMMALGAVGVVSVAGHLGSRQISRMVAAAAAGDWDEARRLHYGLIPLFAAAFAEPSPSAIKSGLTALWEPVGDPRLPNVAASAEATQAVKEAVGLAQQL